MVIGVVLYSLEDKSLKVKLINNEEYKKISHRDTEIAKKMRFKK